MSVMLGHCQRTTDVMSLLDLLLLLDKLVQGKNCGAKRPPKITLNGSLGLIVHEEIVME